MRTTQIISTKNLTTSFNRTLNNLIVTFGGNILCRGAGIITSVMLARHLGPENYGRYILVISFCYIFMVIADFGLNELIVRDIAKDYSIASKYIAATLILKLFFSCIAIILVGITTYLMGYSNEVIFYVNLFSIHIIFITLSTAVLSVFRAFERMEFVSLINIINSLLGLLLISIFIYLNGTILQMLLSKILAFFMALVIGFIIMTKKFVKPDYSFNLSFLKRLSINSFPFLTIAIVHGLYMQIDVILLSKIKGEIYVGWYAPAAQDLLFGLFIIPQTISTIIFPILSRQHSESEEQMIKSCNFTVKILTIVGVAISAGTFILADKIIYFIYGPHYENSIIILRIVSIGISFIFAREPFGYGLAVIGKVKTLMWLNIYSLSLSFILNLVLIQYYAHVGAAVASVICIFLSFVLGYYFLNKELNNIVVIKYYFKPIMAAIIMCTMLYFLKDLNLIIVILIGAIVYILSIFILNTFNHSELSILKKVISYKSSR